jgi:phosphatidylinositol kinase/protein kinase (PI-3  family)
VANDVWALHPQARRRHLSLTALNVVPINPNLRLVEDDPHFATLADGYEVTLLFK